MARLKHTTVGNNEHRTSVRIVLVGISYLNPFNEWLVLFTCASANEVVRSKPLNIAHWDDLSFAYILPVSVELVLGNVLLLYFMTFDYLIHTHSLHSIRHSLYPRRYYTPSNLCFWYDAYTAMTLLHFAFSHAEVDHRSETFLLVNG